jgi:hypothetical protein
VNHYKHLEREKKEKEDRKRKKNPGSDIMKFQSL